jgi:uncharacterized protein (TIGR03437 family)
MEREANREIRATLSGIVRIYPLLLLFAATGMAQLQITTSNVPVATQYQSYNTTLTATGGTPPYKWSVVASTGVGLPEGMTLNPGTGVVNATQVAGQGGYQVTIQVNDSASPTPNTATAALNFGVNSDTSLAGCQLFPPDSIYNQRVDQLPVDTNPAHQIPGSYLASPLHPDFGHGFYPAPGGIPWMRVPANQPVTNVSIPGGGQIDSPGTYSWPFPPYPNAVVEGTSDGLDGGDHHILILESSVNNITGPQTGPCILYETYQYTAVPSMFDSATNTWLLSAGAHYVLNSDLLAVNLDQGGQDSPGIPMVPLLLRYSDVPLLAQHPLRITFPSPTNSFVWPATGCCSGSGPPQGLLYRLKASVNWQATCPPATYPQAATVLATLQQYGAYMSDHGSPGYIQGAPDVRWADLDLACIKQFHVSDLEVVDNSALEISSTSGQTRPYVAAATLPPAAVGAAYSAAISAVGGNPATRRFSVASGALPPGLTLDPAAGTITGTVGASAASLYTVSIAATDTATGYSSQPQSFVIGVNGGNSLVSISSLINSASFTGSAIAPGELVTIQGEMLGPASGLAFSTNPIAPMLGGTQVYFGAGQAPLLYASATQINALVPWEIAGQSAITVVVESAAGSTSLNVAVADAAPGIFTQNSTGTGQAVAINQDGSMNTPANPAAAGSYISVYFTGGGVTNPPGLTGSVNDDVVTTLAASSAATVGGVPGLVTFAGSAPGFVGGVNQMNILLSPNTPSGSQPLAITVGGQSTAATATVSVQ